MGFRKRAALAVGLMFLLSASASAAFTDYEDDFHDGIGSWSAGAGWSLQTVAPADYWYRGDTQTDTLSFRTSFALGQSWSVSSKVKFRLYRQGGNTIGTAAIGFSDSTVAPALRMLVDFQRATNGSVHVDVAYLQGATWTYVLNSAWIPGAPDQLSVSVQRSVSNSDRVLVTVNGGNGFTYAEWTAPIGGAQLDNLKAPGYRVAGAQVDFTDLDVHTPLPSPNDTTRHFQSIGWQGVSDLLSHWWIGGSKSGSIVPTWNGYTAAERQVIGLPPMPVAGGGVWERGMMVFALDALHQMNGDIDLSQRIRSQWLTEYASHGANDFTQCGSSTYWPAADDVGWNAMLMLTYYQTIRNDQNVAIHAGQALTWAKDSVTCAYNRWADGQLGGGMWYDDSRTVKSLYAVGIIYSALRIYELTGDVTYWNRATNLYIWIESYLLRSLSGANDDLYWADRDMNGPLGWDRANDIHEAGSVTYIGGNFAMGVIHAYLYRLTGSDIYRQRAIRTADALPSHLVDAQGRLINDRDAWTDGTFSSRWAIDVLSLPGIAASHKTTVQVTADSIHDGRDGLGYYRGDWDGGVNWDSVNTPPAGTHGNQITTSSSSVGMMLAGGFL